MKKTSEHLPPIYSAIDVLQNPDSAWIKTPEERAAMTLACKDGDTIPRIPEAGESKTVGGKDVQIMHNGLLVLKDGYQGTWETKVIKGLRGIHEPQEEKVFYEVLKRLPANSVMLELGSWWSYYSMWFLKTVKNGKAYCTEPDPVNIQLGKANAALNGFKEEKDIHFRPYASGSADGTTMNFKNEDKSITKVPIRSVDSIVKEEYIDKLALLHFDIQGAELDTLHSAIQTIKSRKVRFVFISTHHYSISGNPSIHQECLRFILAQGGTIIAKHTINESCSGDGLIVASFDEQDRDFQVTVTPQPTDDSLFRVPEEDTAKLVEAYDWLRKEYLTLEKNLSDEIKRNQQHIEKLQHNLEFEIEKVHRLEADLDEITPLRKHVKKNLKARLKKTDN